jgi:hypothetical protein
VPLKGADGQHDLQRARGRAHVPALFGRAYILTSISEMLRVAQQGEAPFFGTVTLTIDISIDVGDLFVGRKGRGGLVNGIRQPLSKRSLVAIERASLSGIGDCSHKAQRRKAETSTRAWQGHPYHDGSFAGQEARSHVCAMQTPLAIKPVQGIGVQIAVDASHDAEIALRLCQKDRGAGKPSECSGMASAAELGQEVLSLRPVGELTHQLSGGRRLEAWSLLGNGQEQCHIAVGVAGNAGQHLRKRFARQRRAARASIGSLR